MLGKDNDLEKVVTKKWSTGEKLSIHFRGWKFYPFLLQWVLRRAGVVIKAVFCFNYILWVQVGVCVKVHLSK